MRKPFMAANWKMFKTREEARVFLEHLKGKSSPVDRDIVIAPSFPLLSTVADVLHGTSIHIAAQNMYFAEEGAFTGEVSPLQLQDVGCRYVIVGHSERRQIFGEVNALVNKKVHAALAHELLPIFCVGETIEEREAGRARQVVEQQVQEGLDGISDRQLQTIIIAYEPLWAIGTGKTATPALAEEMHGFLHSFVPDETRIIYGGSVKPDNAAELFSQPSIDGFLVGGASLKPDDFHVICSVRY